MLKVFITDAGQRKSIPIIRALGRENIPVIAGEEKSGAIGFFSRYTLDKYIYPSPENEDAFIEWLISMGKKKTFDIIFPIDEKTLRPISKHLDVLSKYFIIPAVPFEIYDIADDKYKTLEYARKVGVPVPETFMFRNKEEIEKHYEKLPDKLLIKPRKSSGSRGIKVVPYKKNIYEAWEEVHSNFPFPLVQEFIPKGGDTFGVELLLQHGKTQMYFMHRRIREFPIHGGPSTLRESVKNKDIIDMGIRLMESISWHGVVMIEFKTDPRNNQPVLMEINPKFWGSIALPIAAGVNFPVALYQMINSEKPIIQPDYPEHVLCRWLLPGDILHFIFNKDRFKLNPSFFDFRKNHFDILSFTDFKPVIGMGVVFLKELFNKKFWNEKIKR